MKYLLILVLLLLSGCTSKVDTVKVVQKCENTFVLSGYGSKIMLFEHKNNSEEFNLLKTYNSGQNAFYDCKRNIIVAIQNKNKKKNLDEGIVTFDISNDSKKLYKTNEGFNGIVAKYKNGFIYSTNKTKQSMVDNGKFGYIPRSKIFSKEFILDSKNKQTINPIKLQDYKNGNEWYYYTEDKLFDLDKNHITMTYPFGMWKISEIIGDNIYVFAGDFLKINLKTKKSINLWNTNNNDQRQNNVKELKLPRKRVGLFVNGIYYIITSSKSWDTATSRSNTKAVQFKKGAIYNIKDNKVSFVSKLPFEDIVYANSPDKKNLYIFTKSRKVIKYNIEQNKIIDTFTIDINLDNKFELSTVGFTKNNFILSFEEDRYRNSYIILVNKSFTKLSKPYNIKMGGIDISTEESIHTNHLRVNNL